MISQLGRIGHAVLLALVLAGCARTPYTDRSQLILVSTEQENALGAQAFGEVLGKSRLDTRPEVVGPVEAVGRRLARVADRPDFEWRFVVIDDPRTQNAFALPGGKIAVYSGLFPLARDSTGLAVVMGHELAHVLARHGAERMSQDVLAQLGAAVLGGLLGRGRSTEAVLAAYGLGAEIGVLLPYSRTQESEADRIGLILMARAGYDPREAIAFWQRMERAEQDAPPELLSTHPSHGTREEQLRAWLPEALRDFETAPRAPAEPLARVTGAP